MTMLKRFLATLALLIGLAAVPADAQTTRDSVVCTACVPVTQQVRDSAVSKTDTLWTYFTRTDTTGFRDSIIVHCTGCIPVTTQSPDSVFDKITRTWSYFLRTDTIAMRDSVVKVAVPVAGLYDTTGFRVLGRVTPVKQGDNGTGPIRLGNLTAPQWVGQMYYDAAAPAPHTQAIRWFYRDGCWGGSSPGYAWFETGLATQRVHDVYYTAYVRVSDNWVGHTVGTKLMLFGWGVNGNQMIVRQNGSPNSATGALRWGISWQGGSSKFPGRTVLGSGSPDADGAWNTYAVATQPRGQWQKLEVVIHAGPQGTGTSWIKLIIDGQLALHLVDMDFRNDTADPYLSAVKQAPVWGGGVSCTAQGGQNLWFSNIYFSGK